MGIMEIMYPFFISYKTNLGVIKDRTIPLKQKTTYWNYILEFLDNYNRFTLENPKQLSYPKCSPKAY